MASPIFTDGFEGADGTLLEAYSASWVRSTVSGNTGPLQITAGRAVQQSSTAAVYCRSDVSPPSPNYDVSATLFFNSSKNSPSVGVCGRMAGPGSAPITFYQARLVNNGSGIVLARFLNGTTLTLSSVSASWVFGEEPPLTLRMDGTQLSVLLNGVVVLGPITDDRITGAGYTGLRFASANTDQLRADNFTVVPLDAAPGAVSAVLNATLEGPVLSGSAQTQASAALSGTLEPVALLSTGRLASTAGLAKTLEPAALVASAYIAPVKPVPEGVEVTLSKVLDSPTLVAAAGFAVKGSLSSTLAGPALVAAAQVAGAVAPPIDISKIHPSRLVMFDGSGSRIVVFEGSGSRAVVFEGSGKRIRVNEMDLKLPIKVGDKWVVDRDRDEESYYGADITKELSDRNTTAVPSLVLVLPYGVEVLEGPDVQVAMIEGVSRTFVAVKLGDVDGDLPEGWRWVARVRCANGERFDKTSWFNEVDP